MDKIKSITSHRFFIPILCLIIAALLIFVAGPYLVFAGYAPLDTFVEQLLLLVIIVGIYLLVQYLKYLIQRKKQDKMVDEMASNDGVTDAIDAESKALKEKFKHAFDTLKKTKGAPLAVSEMPWYMIIGSPGSGKTTLLSNSGLHFPLFNEFENKAIQGIGGTKNCDWWITQEAVLLDTAGRYASQDSFQKVDESGWKNFLAMIKRYRKKPISGLLVSFSMSDLMTMNEYELSQLTFQLKRRIAEVNDYFNTRFPVYIILTKSDMLAGFTQFYEPLSHKEREQTLGITFGKDVSLAEQVTQHFGFQFEQLHAAQARRRWTRMSLERDANRKALVYAFSDQLASIKPALITILEGLSKHDEGMKTGIIRGLYFTSGTQSGAPIDRMINKVSQAFGLSNNAKVLWNSDERSYFIKDLLSELVFKEADKFGTLSAYEKKKRIIKQALMGATAAVTLAICAGLFVSYSNNSDYITQSEQSVETWLERYNNKTGNEEIRQYIPALNDFADDIQGLADKDAEQFSSLGLGQANALQSALTASYNRLLQTVLLPYVQQQVLDELKKADDVNAQYQALKSYLMLASNERRDNDFIKAYLEQSLNNNAYFSEPEFLQVMGHVNNLVDNNMVLDSINEQAVAQARRTLSAQPLGDIYYKQFKDRYLSDATKYLSMAQLSGTNWRVVLNTTLDEIQTISRLYTPEVFNQVLDEDIGNYIDQLDAEAWILGPDNVINQTGLSEQIEKLYARDYVNTWQRLLNSISIKSSNNLASLNSGLQLLAEVDSPMFILLSSASEATKLVTLSVPTSRINLGSSVNRALEAAGNSLNADDPKFFITTRFTKLHELMSQEKRAATEQRLAAILQQINVALSFNMQSAQSTLDANIVNDLQGYGYLQVEPLNRWIGQLANNIQSAQNKVEKNQISARWEQQVLPKCKETVDFKYPFARGASVDASLREINQLFGPRGLVYSFFTDNLANLVNTQTLPWQWKTNVQQNYGFNDEVLPFFEGIYRIQRSLYASGGEAANMPLTLTPVYLDPRLARFRMQVYGARLNYQFGRPTATAITWPPEAATARAEFNFVRRDGSEVNESREGIFALFKLINNAEIKRINANKVNVTFTKNNYKAIYELSASSPINPLVFSSMANLNCISSL
jgi:type VI secretion system protein ImpL